jgi:hypothetical protein
VTRITGAGANVRHIGRIRPQGRTTKGDAAMRRLIINAVAAVAMTVIGGVTVFAPHGQSPAAAQRAMMLNNLSEHSRTIPLWVPG